MQSLSLDVNVISEEGADIEIREEEDDLLRAAEELGIDLSGVRATGKDGKQPKDTPNDEAEEQEETEDEVAAEAPSDE
jgi:DNA-directed RNA polymerase subunit beta